MTKEVRVTFIIKDMSDEFFNGFGESIVGFNNMDDAAKFSKLSRQPALFPVKVGNGSFRDRVELNQITRTDHKIRFSMLTRRGYRLAEFFFAESAPGAES